MSKEINMLQVRKSICYIRILLMLWFYNLCNWTIHLLKSYVLNFSVNYDLYNSRIIPNCCKCQISATFYECFPWKVREKLKLSSINFNYFQV